MIECTFYFLCEPFPEAFTSITDCTESCQIQNSPEGGKWSKCTKNKKRKHTDNSIFILSAASFVFVFHRPNSFFFYLALLVNLYILARSRWDSDGRPRRTDVVGMFRCFFCAGGGGVRVLNPPLRWVHRVLQEVIRSVEGTILKQKKGNWKKKKTQYP